MFTPTSLRRLGQKLLHTNHHQQTVISSSLSYRHITSHRVNPKVLATLPPRYRTPEFTNETVIFTWGHGAEGQLGYENYALTKDWFFSKPTFYQEEPRRIVPSSGIDHVAFGGDYTLGVTKDGKLLGWGKGYLGNVTNVIRTPTLISTNFKSSLVYASFGHAAVIDESGNVHTWGRGVAGNLGYGTKKIKGQLGHGDEAPVDAPKKVEYFEKNDIKIVSASLGYDHSLFLDNKGQVYACGSFDKGVIGNEQLSHNELVPVKLNQENFFDEKVTQVAAGNKHSVALTESGKIFSWGYNRNGQLGQLSTVQDMYAIASAPQQLIPGDNEITFRFITAGRNRTSAVSEDGKLWIWGESDEGFKPYDSSDKIVKAAFFEKQGIAYLTEDHKLRTLSLSSGKFTAIDDSTEFDNKEYKDGLDIRLVYDLYPSFGPQIGLKASPKIIKNQ